MAWMRLMWEKFPLSRRFAGFISIVETGAGFNSIDAKSNCFIFPFFALRPLLVSFVASVGSLVSQNFRSGPVESVRP